MQKFLWLILLVLIGACRSVTGSGNMERQTRQTEKFTKVNISGGFEAEISQGPPNVIVEADDNIINEIETHVNNGELKIRLRDIDVTDANMRIFITVPDLQAIKTSASASVQAKELHADRLLLDASSGSSINAAVDAPEVKIEASSGGELTVSGRTKNLDADVSSGASIRAHKLMSENSVAEASSGGTLQVHASVSLDANASSGGSISYIGDPSVKQKASSGGTVSKN